MISLIITEGFCGCEVFSYPRQHATSESRVPRAARRAKFIGSEQYKIRASSSTGSSLPVPHGYVLIPVKSSEGATIITIKESSISLTLYAQARPTP